MKAAYNEVKFGDFLADLILGNAALEDLTAKMEFKKADAWDGKDAPPMEVSLKVMRIILTSIVLGASFIRGALIASFVKKPCVS